MANMIDSQLEVCGQTSEVDRFIAKSTGPSGIDLVAACPGAKDPFLFDQDTMKLGPGMYDIEGQSRYLFRFRTKWNPPIEFVRNLSLEYPGLEFALHYYDLLGSCYGDFEVRNGEVRIQSNRKLDEITAYERRNIDGCMI